MDTRELNLRKIAALKKIEFGTEPTDLLSEVPEQEVLRSSVVETEKTKDFGVEDFTYPDNLAPTPKPLLSKPDEEAALPEVDILVVTWTIAELNALADVLTPNYERRKWYRYRRNFESHFDAQIRKEKNARYNPPVRKANRLGSYFLTQIGKLKVLCFKSELHLNQDGIWLNEDGTKASKKTGYATLPVKDLFKQLIEECKPGHVLTTGTSGAVYVEHDLGDVVVTRGAKFRLSDEFKKEAFNAIDKQGPQYKSDWEVPTYYFENAIGLMKKVKHNLIEPVFAAPTKRFNPNNKPAEPWENNPDIKMDGQNGIPAFHPIISTDFFEFGTSDNNMEAEGAAVEMGDAVLGMVCDEMEKPPKWLVIRNVSDPQINADLPTHPKNINMQIHWAVWYYETYGYWTSVNSALVTWAVIAGINKQQV